MEKMELDLRPILAHELDPIYAWIENDPRFKIYGMFRKRLEPSLLRALENPDAHVIGALKKNSDELLGFAWFLKTGAFGRSGYLRLISVAPSAKGMGIGRALLGHLEELYLVPNGILLLATTTNSEAHRFYEKMGYRRVGEIPDYLKPGIHETIFQKPPTKYV